MIEINGLVLGCYLGFIFFQLLLTKFFKGVFTHVTYCHDLLRDFVAQIGRNRVDYIQSGRCHEKLSQLVISNWFQPIFKTGRGNISEVEQ